MTAGRQQGFSLINVMVAILIFSFGLLGLVGLYSRFTSATSANQNLMQMAPWSNGFWGVVQANPAVLTTMSGTYAIANITAAPATLQPWLRQVLDTGQSRNALPSASVTIATGPDASRGTACSATNGCSVTLTIQWAQNGSVNTDGTSVLRTQTFSYQFGL